MYGLPFEDGSFDTVTIDRVLAAAERPAAVLAEAARTLRRAGRLVVVEDFDQIEARAGDNPLAQLRRWLAGAGLRTGRLRPCDLAGGHFIVALAQPRRQPETVIERSAGWQVACRTSSTPVRAAGSAPRLAPAERQAGAGVVRVLSARR